MIDFHLQIRCLRRNQRSSFSTFFIISSGHDSRNPCLNCEPSLMLPVKKKILRLIVLHKLGSRLLQNEKNERERCYDDLIKAYYGGLTVLIKVSSYPKANRSLFLLTSTTLDEMKTNFSLLTRLVKLF
jgi:hypothetical protein